MMTLKLLCEYDPLCSYTAIFDTNILVLSTSKGINLEIYIEKH